MNKEEIIELINKLRESQDDWVKWYANRNLTYTRRYLEHISKRDAFDNLLQLIMESEYDR